MRLALKHQIILAPATVLLMMALLLAFLQYTYWDLSVKRQSARSLGTVYVALAEADLAAQHLNGVARRMSQAPLETGAKELQAVQELYRHLNGALARVQEQMPVEEKGREIIQESLRDLDPAWGIDPERFLAGLEKLRPELDSLAQTLQSRREEMRSGQSRDIDELVARTTLVSLFVLSAAILLGILLSLFFARRILRRIQTLSDSAGRIARGDLTPPPAPQRVADELDDLALSINRMTEQLIRVVGTEKLLEGAEEERRRLAMDIHDQTLADLSSVLRGIQALRAMEPCRAEAGRLEEELQRAIANLREVMDNLHPQTLDILGLGAALESHLERHLAKGRVPEYHFYVSREAEAAPLSRLARLTIYRIAVEAIHNVLKHARANRFEITLDLRNGELVLAVEDNGAGFDEAKLGPRRGRGLSNIRERAHAIGGRVQWGPSRFTSGTRFELILPLANLPPDKDED